MDYFEIEELLNSAIEQYDALFNETVDAMSLDKIPLADALKEQVPLMIRWEIMSKKFNYIYDEAELLEDSEYANALKKAITDKYRDVSYNEAKEYAKGDKAYINVRKLRNKIRSYRDECKGLLESVHSRKYILNNMTQAMVASVDRNII